VQSICYQVLVPWQLHVSHLQVRIDRAAYHFRCQRCEDFHDGLSLIVDGCDFGLNSLPHFSVLDKFSQEGWKVKVFVLPPPPPHTHTPHIEQKRGK
jgi:hypothetical protein